MAEMLTLLAVLILMGIIHKPRLTMYWSKVSKKLHQYSVKS